MRKDRRAFVTESKPKKQRRKLGKKGKIVILSTVGVLVALAIVFTCLYFFVWNKPEVYIREYSSGGAFTKLTKAVELSDYTTVYEYDVANDVFVTQSSYVDGALQKTVTLYGLADREKEYIRPCYAGVVSVKGDYAIVLKNLGSSSGTTYIGLIRFRGEGTENGPKNVSDFSIPYSASNGEQFYFCGDYLCVMGDVDTPSSEAAYTTFYNYTKYDRLLECFRIRYGYESASGTNYNVLQYDSYIVAYNDTNAYFFDVESDRYNGYLQLSPGGSFVSDFTSTQYTVRLSIVYLGNGWFMRYASQTSSSPFDGYKICYLGNDISGNATLVYARTQTDFYNVKTGVTKSDARVSAVIEVANKYTWADFAATSNSYNNSPTAPDDYPCMNPADMIADGYTLLYHYYRPYVANESLSEEERSLGKETYSLLDRNMNIVEPETMFPVVWVDGNGFETADPYFEINWGDAEIYAKNGKKKLFYADDQYTYAVVNTRENCAIVAQLEIAKAKEESEDTGILYGAATADGKIIVDCEYDKLSAFYGGYAIGYKIVGEKAVYYRIAENGTVTPLDDVALLKDGVYVYTEGDYSGLKTYDGKILKEAIYDSIAVADNYMVNGVYQKSYVITTVNDRTEIYILE